MAQTFVESKLKASKVTMFEKPACPYCVRAKGILQKYKFKEGHLEIVNISNLDIVASVQDYFLQKTGERTVPRIYIGEKCIGGCSDLVPLDSSGELEKMLQSIGALQ
ncbi:glutaredoxin-1 [Spea bombifrons]|uniref:glutaredoxin-1 n=1 Tax=Spea bombifrons TaxID=233779 RepID=UPI00234B2A01|nr:glutaredoxin-1 [Spea bombifrons]